MITKSSNVINTSLLYFLIFSLDVAISAIKLRREREREKFCATAFPRVLKIDMKCEEREKRLDIFLVAKNFPWREKKVEEEETRR